jgi:hypothetical protein
VSEKAASTLFLGAIPYSADLERLDKAFGVPERGTVLLWEQIETVLELQRDLSRVKDVTTTWRKKLMREHKLVTSAEYAFTRGLGIRVLTDEEAVQHAMHRRGKAKRQIKQAGRDALAARSEALSEPMQASREHLLKVLMADMTAMDDGSKRLRFTPLPTQTLPRGSDSNEKDE